MPTYFEADFNDGTTYTQGVDDKSIDTEGKNAFFDIIQRMDKIVRFHLIKDGKITYTVDLVDGHFEVNGEPFAIHDQLYVPHGKLKLIYFKEMHQNFRVGEQDPYETRVNRYFIGWEDEASTFNKIRSNGKQTLAIRGE